MNLAILKKSRKRPVAGDLFALKPAKGVFLFGRVVKTGVNAGGFPNANLIYIYRTQSTHRDRTPTLSRDNLLIPPLMTNNLPWTRGYLEFIEHRSLEPEDVLPRHCFRGDGGLFFDEAGERIAKPEPPIGDWGLHSFRTIDDAVSEALGLPLSPD